MKQPSGDDVLRQRVVIFRLIGEDPDQPGTHKPNETARHASLRDVDELSVLCDGDALVLVQIIEQRLLDLSNLQTQRRSLGVRRSEHASDLVACSYTSLALPYENARSELFRALASRA